MSEIICASCGTAVPADTKFCSACGAKMTETPVPAAVAAAFPAAPVQVQCKEPPAQAQPQHQYEQAVTQAQDQPQLYAQPVQAQTAAATPMAAPVPNAKPMSLFAYWLTMLVFTVPVVGLVLAFVWALGKKTGLNRKNFARAQIIIWGIFFTGALVFYILHFSALNELIEVILA